MQTVLIFDQCCQEPICFFIFEGCYAHLDKIYINGGDEEDEQHEKLEQELISLVYDEGMKLKDTKFDKFPMEHIYDEPIVIVAGFLP